jgi:hypothetical protein
MLSIAESACIEAAWRPSLLRQIALPWSQRRMRLWHQLTCWMGVFPGTELRPERFLAFHDRAFSGGHVRRRSAAPVPTDAGQESIAVRLG